MNKNNTKKGHIIILNTLVFFVVSISIIFALTSPVVSSFNITNSFSKSKQSFMLANSAMNEAIYKIKTNKNFQSNSLITLEQGNAEVEITSIGEDKEISIHSSVDTYESNYHAKLTQGRNIGFEYGAQVGQGGFELQGGSGIIGNVYANGKIIGSNNSYITGTAVSANITDPVSITSNNIGVIDPSGAISFGGNSTTTPQDIAQSFSISTTTPVSSIRILIKKTETPTGDITVRIVEDSEGKPGKIEKTKAVIKSSTVTSTFNYINLSLDGVVSLTPNTTYWLVFDTETFANALYSLGANSNSYSEGGVIFSKDGWSQSNGGVWESLNIIQDTYFDIFVGGETGYIENMIIGSNGEGDAWSYQVKNSNIAGQLYCLVGVENNKNCNTTRQAPTQYPLTISDEDIASWKEIATNNGATTTQSFSGGNYTLDSTKITGDLNVSSQSVLSLNGPVYVTGDVNVSAGSVIQVNPSLSEKSIALVADGVIKTNSGGVFANSGAQNSYIMLVTTSMCPYDTNCSNQDAIHITGGSGAVILNAQKGSIVLEGGAQAKQVTGYKVLLNGGSTITYESGLIAPLFSFEGSNQWKLNNWKEIE